MLSLTIADVKGFMGKLLKSDCFDTFELHSLSIHSFAIFEVNKFHVEHEASPMWVDVRPFAFEVVKGGKQPRFIKVVLGSPDGETARFMNITFEEGKVTITNGLSQKGFTLDKSAHHTWDDEILQFLASKKIEYTNELL
ncbi:MAG: DUF5721 family protein [Defluviitaleaceae bacterium]|nr:DUF5721 family protein [Defluviitaleaceae bacterium]